MAIALANEAAPCRACGVAGQNIPVLHGLPNGAALEAGKRGELILAGCVCSPATPDHYCTLCGHGWHSPIPQWPRLEIRDRLMAPLRRHRCATPEAGPASALCLRFQDGRERVFRDCCRSRKFFSHRDLDMLVYVVEALAGVRRYLYPTRAVIRLVPWRSYPALRRR